MSKVEKLFTVFDETAQILADECSYTYLEALAETGENLFQQSVLQKDIGDEAARKLLEKYESVNLGEYSKEEIRKSFQLALLKGMRDSVQPNHQMTPDTVGLLIGYLVGKFVKDSSLRIFDPAVGTGNLLTTVANQQEGKELMLIGSEVDDLLIKLAYVNANLQQTPVELFHQDSLQPLLVDPVDVVVCDLPVGYYPDDERAKEYRLKADEGHSYAHHLLIEQSINHTKPAGYLFFLIPNGLFESPEAPKLRDYLKDEVHIQSVISLPRTMFKNEKAAKSIFILQKKGPETKAPKQVLLVEFPSLSNMGEVENILRKIDAWIKENK